MHDHLVTVLSFSISTNFIVIFKICLEILWFAQKFLVTQINDDDEVGYDIDQELTIVDMLKELGLENAYGTRIPIDDTTNDVVENDVMLPI